jgi:hypothetical protein
MPHLPSSELLGYFRLSLQDKDVGNEVAFTPGLVKRDAINTCWLLLRCNILLLGPPEGRRQTCLTHADTAGNTRTEP